MKGLVLLFSILSVCILSYSQIPVIKWEKNFGGSNEDECYSICNFSDSTFILCGATYSWDHDVHHLINSQDVLLAKVTSSGNFIWEKTYGGTDNERGNCIIHTNDNCFVIAGITDSNDHDVFGLHIVGIAYDDGWILKIDSTGTLLWQRCVGGSNTDYLQNIEQTSDSGFIAIGGSYSSDFDVNFNHGGEDVFVVKLDKNGNVQWARNYGGVISDHGKVVKEISKNIYFIGADVVSFDGDISGQHNPNSADIWIAKIDSAGNLLSQKCFGGSAVDNISNLIVNGNYLYIFGETASSDGDIVGNTGGFNLWMAKVDTNYNIIWQRNYGGIYAESCFNAHTTSDGGFVFAGIASVDDGIISGTHGFNDYLVLKVDSNGNYQWSKCLGGLYEDFAYDVIETADHDYIVVGKSESDDGDVSNNYGLTDWWVAKISTDTTTTTIAEGMNMERASIHFIGENENYLSFYSEINCSIQIQLLNPLGQIIFETTQEFVRGVNNVYISEDKYSGLFILKMNFDSHQISHLIHRFQ